MTKLVYFFLGRNRLKLEVIQLSSYVVDRHCCAMNCCSMLTALLKILHTTLAPLFSNSLQGLMSYTGSIWHE